MANLTTPYMYRSTLPPVSCPWKGVGCDSFSVPESLVPVVTWYEIVGVIVDVIVAGSPTARGQDVSSLLQQPQ